MNRRQALSALVAAPLLPIATALGGTETEIRYKDTNWSVWTEKLAGQEVEFATMQDALYGSHKVRAYWRSHESPRRAYSYGFLVPDEDVADFGYDAAIHGSTPTRSQLRHGAPNPSQMSELRQAMTNTIRHVHYGSSVRLPFAPIKPEGGAFAYM